MRALVTGGAGFIGSHLVDRLIAQGNDVVVLDDCSTGREQNLTRAAASGSLQLRRGSILDEALLGEAMEGAQIVYHLAAIVGVHHVVSDPIRTITTNVRGTENVLHAAMARGCRLVFASSSEIYGTSTELPFREDCPGRLGPTWVGRWSYACSKAIDEHLCFGFASRGLSMSIVRYFNIYGPRMDPAGYGSVIARFISQARAGLPLTVHGDGRQSRCFTFVAEAVTATILAGTEPGSIGEAINVGSRAETTIGDLAHEVLAATGRDGTVVHVPYESAFGPNFGDTPRRVPDVAKARRVLGWEALVPLSEGLAATLAADGDS